MAKILSTILAGVGKKLHALGGIKQFSIDAIVSVVLIPVVLCIAAIDLYCMLLMCVLVPLFLGYAQWMRRSYAPRTKFFLMWSMWSAIYLWLLFEMTVPLLELLPEENFIFISAMFVAVFCFYRVRQRAPDNFVAPHTDDIEYIADSETTRLPVDDDHDIESLDDSTDCEADPAKYRMSRTNNLCPKCRRYMPPRAFHCFVCQQCIAKRNHHSVWLDCCVGESNHKYFLAGCMFAAFALFFGANLSFTSICHPVFVFRIFGIDVLVPDDCSDVFDQFDKREIESSSKLVTGFSFHLHWFIYCSIGLCFVGSIYATVMAVCLIIVLCQQAFFILKGVTASEWSRGETNRNGCFHNLKSFICCSR